MPIISCPRCRQQLSFPDHLAGQKVRCQACHSVLTAPAAAIPASDIRQVDEYGFELPRRSPGIGKTLTEVLAAFRLLAWALCCLVCLIEGCGFWISMHDSRQPNAVQQVGAAAGALVVMFMVFTFARAFDAITRR
jgi:hypothetical protein